VDVMTKRLDGFRKKTRSLLKKERSQKGKLSIRKFLQKLEVGEKVYLVAEPAYQNGMHRPKYEGKRGIVKSKKGSCYEIEIKDLSKTKTVLVHPIHITKVDSTKAGI
jgi:large subunit ribosomal protein L21e